MPTIASEAEIAANDTRKYLGVLEAVGDIFKIQGDPIRFYVSEQGDQRIRQQHWSVA